jgi:hypothetical protein
LTCAWYSGPLSRKRSSSCHTCCDMRHGLSGLIRRTVSLSCLLRHSRGCRLLFLTRIPTEHTWPNCDRIIITTIIMICEILTVNETVESPVSCNISLFATNLLLVADFREGLAPYPHFLLPEIYHQMLKKTQDLRPKICKFFAISGGCPPPLLERPPFRNFWICHCLWFRRGHLRPTKPLGRERSLLCYIFCDKKPGFVLVHSMDLPI